MVITHKLKKEEIEVLQWCVRRAAQKGPVPTKCAALAELLSRAVEGSLRINVGNSDRSAIDRPGPHEETHRSVKRASG